MAGLLNYSTTIAVPKTVGEVQAILMQHKCRGIQTRYDDHGEITAMLFTLKTQWGDRDYALPVNVDGVYAVLQREKQAGTLPNLPWSRVDRGQAARIAWRILKDWLEAQLAIIQSQVVSLDQVLLPFQVAGEDGATVWQIYQRQQLALQAPRGE